MKVAEKKTRPRVGDTCWFVDWTYEFAVDENGDADFDNHKTRCRRVATREEAEALARDVWPQTVNAYGVVTFHPAVFEAYDEDDALIYPHVGSWQATGDEEVYEGPGD